MTHSHICFLRAFKRIFLFLILQARKWSSNPILVIFLLWQTMPCLFKDHEIPAENLISRKVTCALVLKRKKGGNTPFVYQCSVTAKRCAEKQSKVDVFVIASMLGVGRENKNAHSYVKLAVQMGE